MKFIKIFFSLLVPLVLLGCLVFLTTGAASYKVYVIHTGSMSPNIPSGSAVLVHEGHYHVGQVITFTEDNLTVTHRLVSISPAGLTTTKGDGNATDDPWHVPKSQIIGGVVVAPRYVGYWIMYVKNPLGLVSILIAALALWQIWSLTGSESRTSESPEELPNRSSPGAVDDDEAKTERSLVEMARPFSIDYAKLIGPITSVHASQKVDVR